MGPNRAIHLLLPISRAIAQFDDPAFRRVVLGSIAWSLVCFAALHFGAVWVIHRLLDLHGWIAWALDIVGSIAASLLAFWLFLPVAAAIGTMYFDRIASAVERRYYPWLGRPDGAPLLEQIWDGVAVALKVLALNIVALLLAFLLPGIGLIAGWGIAAYAIGRGLFVAVAMRRMPRYAAESLYRSHRGLVLVQGGFLAAAAYIPIMNLFIPTIGIATMIHILDITLTTGNTRNGDRFATV